MYTTSDSDPALDETQPARGRFIALFPMGMLAVNFVLLGIGFTCLWYFFVRPMQEHSRNYHRLSDAVESLVHRRPPGVTKNEWSYVIGWTRNAIGNCCSIPDYLNKDEASHERFRTLPERFEGRLREDVTLETIDWLWDEFEAISKYGERYSMLHRPTTPEHLAEADHVSNGIVVD